MCNSKSLIYDIFSTTFGPDFLWENLTAIVSDHRPQFVIASNIFSNSSSSSNTNIYERDWTTFDQESFIYDK